MLSSCQWHLWKAQGSAFLHGALAAAPNMFVISSCVAWRSKPEVVESTNRLRLDAIDFRIYNSLISLSFFLEPKYKDPSLMYNAFDKDQKAMN